MGDAYGYGEQSQMANPKGMKRMSTGSIFYKTKLCSKFRAGNCPYINNCNFAHGMEELRKPPPGWEEFVNPPLVPDNGPSQKSKPCKKFFNEGSCPYGDRCIFSHEDLTTPVMQAPVAASGPSVNNTKPSNWKTRLCNKWETTGYCPFGEKCHFAHGLAELHKYTGVESPSVNTQMDTKKPPLIKLSDSSQYAQDSRIFTPPPQQQQQHIPVTSSKPVHVPVPSSKPAQVPSKPANIPVSSSKPVAASAPVWKGPTEGISTIYGDWLEDNEDDEWEEQMPDQQLFAAA